MENTALDHAMQRLLTAERLQHADRRALSAATPEERAPGIAGQAVGAALITIGTMFLAAFVQAGEFGWPISLGMVALLFLHEAGHWLTARLYKLPVRGMVFVPFLGAAVLLRHTDRQPLRDAILRLAGPLAGALGSAICIALYWKTGQGLWRALAIINSTINLFNLAPVLPLDGGLVAPIVPARALAVGLALVAITGWRDPICWLIALTGLPRIAQPAPVEEIPRRSRWLWSAAYLALALALSLSNQWLQGMRR